MDDGRVVEVGWFGICSAAVGKGTFSSKPLTNGPFRPLPDNLSTNTLVTCHVTNEQRRFYKYKWVKTYFSSSKLFRGLICYRVIRADRRPRPRT